MFAVSSQTVGWLKENVRKYRLNKRRNRIKRKGKRIEKHILHTMTQGATNDKTYTSGKKQFFYTHAYSQQNLLVASKSQQMALMEEVTLSANNNVNEKEKEANGKRKGEQVDDAKPIFRNVMLHVNRTKTSFSSS